MNLLLALVIAVLFGVGTFLLLKRDLVRVVSGIIVISNASILLVVTSGMVRGQAPLYPLAAAEPVSDPLVQAMALTAVVISFGATALLIGIVYRVAQEHHSIDQNELVLQEAHDLPEDDSAYEEGSA
jgi:multicomponent Na+:H+ antiporter subunit C